jgi:hypothetical protein
MSQGIDQRAEVLQDATDSLRWWPRIDGQRVVPSSAFVTIHDPDGSERVARTAVTPTSEGQLVRSQAWPEETYPLAEDYWATWEWVVDGSTYFDRMFFDVVLAKLTCPIEQADLRELYPDLDAYLKGLRLPDAAPFIRRAWSEICDRIRSAGNRPSLILDTHRLTNPALHLSASYLSNALTKASTDHWAERKREHRERYEQLWGGLGELKYDSDEDGTASVADKKSNLPKFYV